MRNTVDWVAILARRDSSGSVKSFAPTMVTAFALYRRERPVGTVAQIPLVKRRVGHQRLVENPSRNFGFACVSSDSLVFVHYFCLGVEFCTSGGE